MAQRMSVTNDGRDRDGSKRFVFAMCMGWLALRPSVAPAQNLVPNPDFEQFSDCPSAPAHLELALFWFNPTPGGPPSGTSDYFNSCAPSVPVGVPLNFAGTQAAHSGVGYAGFAAYSSATQEFREYVEVPLTEPLVVGTCYQLSFHVSQADTVKYATCNLGALFSDTMFVQSTPGPLLVAPSLDSVGGCLTDAENWTLVSGVYQAHGGESYLVIGNFHNDATTTVLTLVPGAFYAHSYYYIDDVSVVEAPVGAACFSVGVEERTSSLPSVYPNPVVDELSIVTNGNAPSSFTLRDARGSTVAEVRFTGSATVHLGQLAQGLYTYELRGVGNGVERGKLIKQ